MAADKEFDRGKWEGCIEQKVKELKGSVDALFNHLEHIYKRLNSIDKKLAATSPIIRIVEKVIIAGIAAGVGALVVTLS